MGDVLTDADITPEMARHPRQSLDTATAHAAAMLYRHAEALAAAEHPDHDTLQAAAHTTRRDADAAEQAWQRQRSQLERTRRVPYRDPTPDLDAATRRVQKVQHHVQDADQAVATATADPAITSQPNPEQVVATARDRWQSDRDSEQARQLARARTERQQQITRPHVPYQPAPARHGPSIGI